MALTASRASRRRQPVGAGRGDEVDTRFAGWSVMVNLLSDGMRKACLRLAGGKRPPEGQGLGGFRRLAWAGGRAGAAPPGG
ncbi:hypothetical protein D3C81_1201660 [compost metagenome]